MRVLVTGKLPQEALALLGRDHEVVSNTREEPMPRQEIVDSIGDKEGLLCTITDRIDEELLVHAENLRMIANYGVGFDHIDLAACSARGIRVSNTPGVLSDATADLTFTLILAVARRAIEGDRMTRSGQFKPWSPMAFLGTEVTAKTLGIIGLGQIGKAVARRARGFDMPILYHSRHRIPEEEEHSLRATYVDVSTLLARSDFVSLHVTLTSETRHLIGEKELNLMKPSAFLINVSRGPVIDEKALTTALRSKTIAGAGLDVYEKEPELFPGLAELDNVVLLPHVGSATVETRTNMALLAVENLLAGLAGRKPPNCLNCVGD